MRPTQEGLYRHFVAVAAAELPILLYNMPSRSGVDMSNDTIRRLAQVPGIVALKDATATRASPPATPRSE